MKYNARIARVGYLTVPLHPPQREYMSTSELFAPATLASFEGKPVLLGHDDSRIVGHIVSVSVSGDYVLAVLELDGKEFWAAKLRALSRTESGSLECSIGCSCDDEERDGVLIRRNIRADEVSLVFSGRAGAECCLL